MQGCHGLVLNLTFEACMHKVYLGLVLAWGTRCMKMPRGNRGNWNQHKAENRIGLRV